MTQSANLHLAGGAKRAAQGLDCDEDGVRLGDCFLVTRDPDEHQTFYRTRPAQDLSGLLSAAFGDAIDAEHYHATLQRVARLMTAGQLGLAQITAIQMRPPDLPNEAADRLMKADALLRFNPNHRGPGPGGGQFISGPSGGGGAAAKPATRPAARSARKPNTTRRPTAPPKREPSLSGPSGGVSGKIQQLGRIINSGEGNYESYNTGTKGVPGARVGHSFISPPAGTVTGKTINQIIRTSSLPGTDRNRMFAVGAYQMTYKTLKNAVSSMGLTGDELLSPRMQDRIFGRYLIYQGGGALGMLVNHGVGTVDAAQYSASKIFASIAVPQGYLTSSKSGRQISDGTMSYYQGAANSANMNSTRALRLFLGRLTN